MPAAEVGVTRWCESKCSDTGEGAVKSLEHRFKFQGKYLRMQSEGPGELPNEAAAWGGPRGPGGSEQPRALRRARGDHGRSGGDKGSNIRDVDSSGMEGRGFNSYVDAWKDVRWHELANCGAWCDGMV